MNPKLFLTSFLLAGGVVATSSATTLASPASDDLPVPLHVVSPANLPRSHIGATVTLRMTIDENGRPQNIRVLSDRDERLAKNLVAAVSQWQFTAPRRNGVAVKTSVELPLTLVED